MAGERALHLALGGGGARGGAHIGVLKVLEQAGIPIGAIAGTSAGGIVGGLYAAGLRAAQIEELLAGIDPVAVLEPDASGWALLSAQRFVELVRRRVGDARIEDLPHPFAAVAVDLRTAEEVVLRAGPLATAVQATMAVPGLLCPVEQGNSLLVDGGVLNNVPVDVVRGLSSGPVLAVDVGVPRDFPLEVSAFSALPGPVPRVLERILTLTGRRGAALAASKSIALLCAVLTEHRLQESPPDLLLRPDLGAIPIMDMLRLREAIAIGERAAKEHLDEIWALVA